MCSRTNPPFPYLSSIQGRRPLRKSDDDDSMENDDTSNDSRGYLAAPHPHNLRPRRSVSPKPRNAPASSVLFNGSSTPDHSSTPPASPRVPRQTDSHGTQSSSSFLRTSESDGDVGDVDVVNDVDDLDSNSFRLDAARSVDSHSPRPSGSGSTPKRIYPVLPAGDDAVGKTGSDSRTSHPAEEGEVRRRRKEIDDTITVVQQKYVHGYNGEPVRVPHRPNPTTAAAAADETSSESSSFVATLLCVLVVAAAAVGLWMNYDQLWERDRDDRDLVERGDMRKLFEALKGTFPNQPRRSWLNFNGPLRRVLRDGHESTEPAFVLISGDASTVRCLVSKTASFLHSHIAASSLPHHLVLEGIKLRDGDPFSVKTQMEADIRSHLSPENGGRVVVISDVDSIPAEAAILLHGLADHENAPFKEAFFFLTVQDAAGNYRAASSSSDERLKEMERSVNRHLTDKLSRTLGIDATLALMARIGNSVVVVAPEDGEGGRC